MKMAIWKQLPGSSSSHGGTLLLLFNVLNHIVIWWGEYRTPSLNQFNFIHRRYREYLFMYRWVCVSPRQTQGHWVSGTSTVRDGQRADSQAATPDIRMLLRRQSHPTGMHRWHGFTSLLDHFVLSRSSLQYSLMRLQSPWITKQMPLTLFACQ